MPNTLISIQKVPPAGTSGGSKDEGEEGFENRGEDSCEIVELPMTSEVRRRLRASDAQELALMLPTGSILHVGSTLYRDAHKTYVVTAAPEDVLVVRPKGALEAAQTGHLVGNLHRDIDLIAGEGGSEEGGSEIVALWTAPLEAQLRRAGLAVTREQRSFKGKPPGEHAHGVYTLNFEGLLDELLPPRYQDGAEVSAAPMRSAGLEYDAAGRVAWDRIWGSFRDLALAGGPTHRGTLLEPPTADEVQAHPEAYGSVVAEIERGVRLVTGLETVTSAALGWVGVRCHSEAMAVWLLRAIIVDNVMVRRQHALLFLPAGPNYRLDKEIKNVVTVIAKTHHYWAEHRPAHSEP